MANLLTRALQGRRPSQPAAVPSTLYGGGEQYGPTPLPSVSSGVLLGLPAAWRCVNLIANGVAAMSPLTGYAPDGVTPIEDRPIYVRPDASMDPFDFWHMAIACAVVRGNFFGIKADYGADGYPNQVICVHPNFVQVWLDADGFLVYNVNGRTYGPDEVVHVRGFTLPNTPRGVGVVENFRRTIGQQLDQQNLAASTYKDGAVPAGIIQFDKPVIDETAATSVKDQWIANHGSGRRAPAVLPSTMSFTPLSFSPEDSQFLQARQFSVAEMAMMFNLDPSDLGASLGGTAQLYANITQRYAARQAEAYQPWMRRFEEAWGDLIPGGNSVRFNPDNGLRVDPLTRAQVDQLDIATGVTVPSERRAARGLPPFTAKQKLELPKVAASPPPPVPAGGAGGAGGPAGPAGAQGTGGLPADAPIDIPGTHITATPYKVKI